MEGKQAAHEQSGGKLTELTVVGAAGVFCFFLAPCTYGRLFWWSVCSLCTPINASPLMLLNSSYILSTFESTLHRRRVKGTGDLSCKLAAAVLAAVVATTQQEM